jgi:hypothetical protein
MKSLVFTAIKNASNVLVIEFGSGPGLLVKAEDTIRVGCHFRRQDFQRHSAVELSIARSDNGRHAADADRLDQFKVGQPAAAQIS